MKPVSQMNRAELAASRQKLAELEARLDQCRVVPDKITARQRKLVTLLFLDVAGSTAMTQHLDPEDTLEIMDNALPRLAVPIEAHGGHVTRYAGDGFKAVFGAPLAREDDPEQAILAGLETLQIAKSLAQELRTEWGIDEFQVRIGIDTGLAAIGGKTEAEDTIMGQVVNLAVRIESAAPPGGMLISHNTYRHVRGLFNVEPQAPITAKGFPEPVPVYQVKEIKPRAFRVQTRGVEGVETRMVGRETELKHLQDALLTAIEECEGHVITIIGEAGVGKSRLLYEFDNWIELLPPPEVRFFQARGRQDVKRLPYSILRDLFAFRFQILDDDTGEEARNKLENGFGEVFGSNEDATMRAHITGQLLGFDFSTSPYLRGILNDPEQLRNRGSMYLIQYFQALSMESPTVIILEDIHWADESSLDLIDRLGEHTPQMRLLIVCAARLTLLERRPNWGEGQSYHTCLELQPLSMRESRHLVAEILRLAKDIPSELRELVVDRTEGNPFYIEELIKMLIEEGVVIPDQEVWHIQMTHLGKINVPPTLAGVLQARLDSLPSDERTVLQQASVVGRTFWDRIVNYIQTAGGNKDDPQLTSQTLKSLQKRELVFRHEESVFVDAIEYLFKHDVLREVTYESVLKRLRKIYHALVAEWLIANSGDRIGEHNGLIAEHLLSAGRYQQACEFLSYAGDHALASYGNREAEGYYRQALELSPPESQRATLLAGLGEALRRQAQHEEAIHVLRQSIDIYQQMDDQSELAYLYLCLSRVLWNVNYQDAWEACQEGLSLLEGAPESPELARILAEAGRTAHFMGDAVSDDLCRRAIEMAERVGAPEAQAEASITLALRVPGVHGRFDDSIRMLEEMISFCETHRLWYSAARAHTNLGAFLAGYDLDYHSGHHHHLQGATLFREIGDVDGMFFCLENLRDVSINLGNLSSLETSLADFLYESTASEARIRPFLEDISKGLYFYRGELTYALEDAHTRLAESRSRNEIQEIANHNTRLALIHIEQYRLSGSGDLSEAEAAVLENFELWDRTLVYQTQLATIYSLQGRFAEAHALLADVYKAPPILRIGAKTIHAMAEGRWNQAASAVRSLIKLFPPIGARWDWARWLIDLGDIYAQRNQPGDLRRAQEAYQESLDIFSDMEASGYIRMLNERVQSLSFT